jgi:type 2 lantibiotic biosynthesis protein LanM
MQTSSLYRALTLNERKKSSQSFTGSHVDLSEALPFWKNVLNIQDDLQFQDFLRENYDVGSEFLSSHFAVDENFDNASEEWFNPLIEVMKGEYSSQAIDEEEIFFSFPFYPFYREFIHSFYKKFLFSGNSAVEKLFSKECRRGLVMQLLDSLYHISHKTLILEINSLRFQGILQGETPEERYHSFCNLLGDDPEYKQSLFVEYPVLYRLLYSRLDHYITALYELAERLMSDLQDIEELLHDGPLTGITQIKLGSGDTHKGGRSVSIVIFEGGKRIVYKPRSLSIDIEFQQFIGWLNTSNNHLPEMKKIRFIEREGYGWSEYIDYCEAEAEEDVSLFYQRLGQLLAVLHIMNATDFHYENIIADQSQPVLIDLESLFHHAVSPDHHLTKSPAVNKALIAIRDSVISTGLIPAHIQSNNQSEGKAGEGRFDVSGVGGGSGQQLPFKVPSIKNQFTDEIKIIKDQGTLSPGSNIPKLNGEEVQILDYLDDISEGFSSYYRFFMNNRESLKDKIRQFGNKEVRKIFRDTMKYAKLLNLSYHPDFLRNQIDREILLNRLWKDVMKEEQMKKLSRYEVNDLLIGDIPYFCTQPQEKRIWSSGGEAIEGFYYKSGLELSLEKIETLNEQDLKYQLSIINSTISAIYSEKDLSLLNFSKKDQEETMDRDAILRKAAEIGDILLDSAISHKGEQDFELCWTSMVLKGMEETSWIYSVTGPGLYDGNTGIALYFSYLWKLTRNDRYKEAAYASISPIKKLMSELIEPDNISIGAYLGISSILYAMSHMSSVFKDNDLLLECLAIAEELDRFIEHDRTLDVIGGAAGALFVVIGLYEQTGKPSLLNTAEKLANHLAGTAISHDGGGASWPPIQEGKDPYIGFSHGNAGIAAALAKYNRFGKSELISNLISEALLYENHFYNEQQNNWFSTHLDTYPLAWCHGSPGILLGRSIMYENGVHSQDAERDMRKAARSCLSSSLGKNYSLCHGDLGLVDVLLKSAESMDDAEHVIQVQQLTDRVCKSMFLEGDGIRADLNSVGIMNGIAGIGYGLLRIVSPKEVPSVLALDPPIK